MPSLSSEPTPRFLEPMLCSTGALPNGDGWAYELKWDGCRGQLRLDQGRVVLRSRPGRDCGQQFPEVLAAGASIDARSIILDGELVCFDAAGRPDFAAIRRRLAGDRGGRAATYIVFDALHLDGEPVRDLPYRERLRAVLHALETRAPRRGRPRRVEPHVAVLVSIHGPRGRPVRDPVIREVCWPGSDLTELEGEAA